MFTIRMQMSFSAITFVANVGRLVVANVRRLPVANMGRLVLANVRRLVLGEHTAIGCSECAAISSGFDIFAGTYFLAKQLDWPTLWMLIMRILSNIAFVLYMLL
jgi:hypothetical protein